jgi:hypothetical protein
MDPYLEHPEFFPGLHDRLITYLCEFLQGILPEPYYVDSRQRVWMEPTERTLEPDIDVLRSSGPSQVTNGGAVSVARPPVAVQLAGEETIESYLEIHTAKGDHPLITAIEVLSPTNKTPGAHGRTQYTQKQEELLKSRVNLVEIDLLRGGHHSTAVPYKDAIAKTGLFDYHVCVRKMDDPDTFFIYPIRLPERLPEILIPLLPGDADVKIDLQPVFDRCYDTGPYRRARPYRLAPEPPLNAEQATWAEQLLREKGLLSAG